MIKKYDFVWHIGFQGNMALVNKRQKQAYKIAKPSQLLADGYLRAAFCLALWESDVEQRANAMDDFIASFVEQTKIKAGLDDLKRLMGVYQVPSSNLNILLV